MLVLLELLLEMPAGGFDGPYERVDVLASSRVAAARGESDAGLLGQSHQGLAEGQVFDLHQEGERVTGLAAAEALVISRIEKHEERRGALVVKWTAAAQMLAGPLQLHVTPDQPFYRKAGLDLFDFTGHRWSDHPFPSY